PAKISIIGIREDVILFRIIAFHFNNTDYNLSHSGLNFQLKNCGEKMPEFKNQKLPFRPRARLLMLLGDQLIRDAGIAVFELVKNAYDADAPQATIMMTDLNDKEKGIILVEDSGSGMDFETVTNVWLEPGTDFRARQREKLERTPIYGRLPLGEKGVGRFAAHKLGMFVRLITRKKNKPEVIVEINWEEFIESKYLEDVPVKVREREPQVFTGKKTGTRIEIEKLNHTWNRGMVRELARAINSICSPFNEEGEFKTEFLLLDNAEWLDGMLDIEKVLEYSLFRAECDIRENPKSSKNFELSYSYKFVPYPSMNKVRGRVKNVKGISLKSVISDSTTNLQKIGPIHIDLYIFDREPKVLELGVSDKKGLKDFLDENGGIRVYRNGIRVYDYGELGNDWLNLSSERVNVPAKRISNNLVIGAVSLDISKSIGLVEKTNREGFMDTPVFRDFRSIVYYAVTQITAERNTDKTRIRDAYSNKKIKEPVLEDLSELRELVEKKKLTEELSPYLNRIEADFVLIRDRFLTSASAGLSLSAVIHEVEKGVAELAKVVKEEKTSPRVKELAKHLADLVEGFAALIRRSGLSREKASSLISQAIFNTEFRLKTHNIKFITNISQGDFEIKCSRRLTISTLMNLLDNSIWWLDNKWGNVKGKKHIYIGLSKEFSDGYAIVVADNGPGFLDPPEYLVEPFISRKPDGMGLGLHLADQVMKAQGGRLVFPEFKDVSLPKDFDGAVVALVFGGTKK
ncbi:MAG TPA: ATP-binding protein, partial [Flavobacterium sp.]|nr:ATP-binding protein [Flavobacterium sp.]